MKKRIIEINEDKCVGCGLCANACQEGAIGMVDGKAKLLKEDYCDGLGRCLPVCPTDAISFVEKEVNNSKEKSEPKNESLQPTGCPGSSNRSLKNNSMDQPAPSTVARPEVDPVSAPAQTHLNQWPVQIQLVSVNAPFLQNAHLLIAADCAAYAYGNFHNDFMKNKVTLIGCPKLDTVEYTEKLTEVLKANSIKSVTVARMEVPCCSGIETATINALRDCGKMIPWQVKTLTLDGKVLED